jgi:hypothetical protein
MKLDDGTSAEVVALENNGGVVTSTLAVTWPDGSVARGFVTFSAALAVTSGPMETKIKGLGGLAAVSSQLAPAAVTDTPPALEPPPAPPDSEPPPDMPPVPDPSPAAVTEPPPDMPAPPVP